MATNQAGQATAKNESPRLRLFYLVRDEDVSGVSGIGRVAVGVVFPSGRVVLEWLGVDRSFEILDNLDHCERIHGHGGKTRIVFPGIRDAAGLEGSTERALISRLRDRWHSIKHVLGRITRRSPGARGDD